MWHHEHMMMMLVFVSFLFFVPVESRDVYNFCDTSHPDIIDMDETSPPILLRSPNFLDGAYTSKQSCSLAIRAGDKPLVLVLKYNLFDLEWNYACHYDSLCVYGVKFCGFWLTSRTQRYFIEKNSTFTMHFKADGTVEKAGFEIKVTAHVAVTQILQVMADGVGCGPNYVDTIPIVYGPRFHYQDKCALLHQTTTLATTTTTTTPEPTTPEPTTPEPLTPEPTTPEPEDNVIDFCEVSPCTTININATSGPIIIRSPKFEHDDYDDNEHCSVVLKSGDDDLILSLYYSFFDIERDFFCSCDSLCVYGVQFCGWWLMRRTYKYIFKAGETFTLDFRTNGAIRRRGFEIHVSVEVAVSQVVHLITRGVGCDHGSIGTDDIVYHPSFNYFDKCAVLSQPICYPTTTAATTTEITPNATSCEDTTDNPTRSDEATDDDSPKSTTVVTTPGCDENVTISLPEVTFKVTDISSLPTEEEMATTECEPENAETMETPDNSNENVTSTSSPATTTIEDSLDCKDDDVYTFCDESTCTIVYINASNPQALIHSPNYGGGEYYHNQHCSIVLYSGAEALILSLTYTFFDVEYDDACSCDSLCVNGVQFCGNWLTGHTFYYIIQAYSTFTLDYKTNNQIKNLGFEICVRSEVASSQTVDQISSGVGCSLEEINIFTVFYQLSYVYTDACSALSHTICHPPHPTTTTILPDTTPDCNSTSPIDSADDSTTTISDDNDSYSTADENFNNTGSVTPRDSDQDTTPCEVDNDTETTTTESPTISTELPTTTCGPEDTEDSTTMEIPDCSDDDAYTFCEDSSCTVVYINATNPKILIHSPNFGKGLYHHGQHCSMILKTGDEPLILTFSHKSFDIEYDDDCCFDSLCVYGVKFCGSWLAGYSVKYVVPAHSFFTLDFQTNGRIKRSGFEICVTAEIATSQTIDLISGGIGSGWLNINVINVMYDLSFNYTDKCSEWSQATCYPKQPKTTTTVQTTESPTDCADDITTSRPDDDATDADNSQTTTGNATRYIDKVTDEEVDVNITTPCNPPDEDGSVTPRNDQESTTPSVTTDNSLDVTTCKDIDGEMDTTTVKPDDRKDSTEKSSECVDGAQTVHTFCDVLQSTLKINASSPPIVIRSPDLDEGSYPENLNCTLTLVSGCEALILTMNYILYDVQHHEICRHDWLCVNGVKFCGCWLFGETFRYMLPPYSTFTLIFKTDDNIEEKGFEIQITHEVAQIGQTIVEAIEGIGSDGLYVGYSNVTYTLDYLYTDECLLFNDD